MVVTDFMKVKRILLEGIKKDTIPVISSYGPNAKGSLVRSSQGAMVYTRDGYSISQRVSPSSKQEEFGLRLAKSVTAAQQNNCGDGTSSALILFYLLCSSIYKKLEYGYNSETLEEIKKSLEEDSHLLENKIEKENLSKDGKDYYLPVATFSMGNFTKDSELLALWVYETVKEVQNGSIEIEVSKTGDSYYQINKGCQRVIEQCSKLLTQTLVNPYVYICDNMLNFAKLNDVFNKCIDESRSILIITSQVDNLNLKQFEALVAQGAIKGNVVRVSLGQGYTEDFLNDMAFISGAKVDYLQKEDETPVFDFLGEIEEFQQEETCYNFKPFDKINLQKRIEELNKIDTSNNRTLQWRVESRKNWDDIKSI